MKKKQFKDRFLEQFNDNSITASNIDESLVVAYESFYNKYIKRLIDLILGIIILLLVSPVIVIVSILILLEDGRPIFYRAPRGGYHGKTFRIFKFRSMVKNADKIGGGTTQLNDSRITKVGSVIRKLKIDEFPNVINVIKGDVSFIGPRPELLRYTEQYEGTEKLILEVRPGMTDYSSIEFINLDEIVGTENADEIYEKIVLPKKNKLRVKYAATVSFLTDVKIFALTVYKVIEKGLGFVFKQKHR